MFLNLSFQNQERLVYFLFDVCLIVHIVVFSTYITLNNNFKTSSCSPKNGEFFSFARIENLCSYAFRIERDCELHRKLRSITISLLLLVQEILLLLASGRTSVVFIL